MGVGIYPAGPQAKVKQVKKCTQHVNPIQLWRTMSIQSRQLKNSHISLYAGIVTYLKMINDIQLIA